MILVPDDIEVEFLQELEILLPKTYEELKEKLSKDMKSYLEKEISFTRFVCSNINSLVARPVDVQAVINLFIAQPCVDYKIDVLLLTKIAENLEDGELLSQINQMIELLEKHERFVELEYKIRSLKSELASGKIKYTDEFMQSSIKERESEMREIEEESNQLISEREKLLSRFSVLSNNSNRRL
jgi:hypothetical protein